MLINGVMDELSENQYSKTKGVTGQMLEKKTPQVFSQDVALAY